VVKYFQVGQAKVKVEVEELGKAVFPSYWKYEGIKNIFLFLTS